MTVNELLKIAEILQENGKGIQYVSADHDCIYFPGSEDLVEMEEYCHWDSHFGCWCAFT
jgi:hypothetical protein